MRCDDYLLYFRRRAQQEEQCYAADIEYNCGMYKILSAIGNEY